jgi:hypothetical protein
MTTIDSTRFNFISTALNGTGGFADGSNLVQYPRESNEKFERRKQIAWYVNHLRPACSRFVGYLSKRPPQREHNSNNLIEGFIQDCDGQNTALDVFLAGFALEAKARGSMLLLVDMPKQLPTDQQTQVEQRLFPYLVPIYPEQVKSYVLNDSGHLVEVEVNGTMLIEGKETDVVRSWNELSWSVVAGGKVIEQGDHNLGICPVLAFSEGASFPYVGDFAQIAYISKRIFNARSELDEILRSQTFSLLTYQVPPEQAGMFDAAQTATAIGTHNMLIHSGNTPQFIAPPDAPAMVYMKNIEQMESAIRDISLAIETPNQAESGIALTIRFQELNSALTEFARRMEDLERRAWFVFMKWLTLPPDSIKVNWARDFSLADLNSEIEQTSALIGIGAPNVYIQEKLKRIAAIDFAGGEKETVDQINAAIDEASFELSAPA